MSTKDHITDQRRELGRIAESMTIGREDHGIWTVQMRWESQTGGSSQGFGGLCLANGQDVPDTEARAYIDGLLAAFGNGPLVVPGPFGGGATSDKERESNFTFAAREALKRLAGEEVYALRSNTSWNQTIDGVESVRTGRRYTRWDFCRAIGLGDQCKQASKAFVVADAKRRREQEIRRADENLERALRRAEEHIDWSKP